GGKLHTEEAVEDAGIAEGVDKEAHPLAEGSLVGLDLFELCNENAGDTGADDAGGVEGETVQGYGVLKLVAGYHLQQKRLAGGHIKSLHHAGEQGEAEGGPEGD